MNRKLCFSLLAALALAFACAAALADTVSLPINLKTVEASVFEGDISLDEVVIPEGVESIGPRAFADSSVSLVHLPGSLRFVDDTAFDGTDAVFLTEPGTWAWAWALSRTATLGFSDSAALNPVVQMAVFEEDESIRLFNDPFAYFYELADYDELKTRLDGDPAWSASLIIGPDTGYALHNYDGVASIGIGMPEEPCDIVYAVRCDWDGMSAVSILTVRFVYPESLPAGVNIAEEVTVDLDEVTALNLLFIPDGYSFGNSDRVGFETEGWIDHWYEGHTLFICPHETGSFTGTLCLYAGNMYIEKQITVNVVDGFHARAVSTGSYRVAWPAAEGVDTYTLNVWEDADCTVLYRELSVTGTAADIGTDVGKQYWFDLEYEKDGEKYYAGPATAEPLEALPAPSGLSLTLAEDGHVLPSWDAVPGADGYRVYTSLEDGGWTPEMVSFAFAGTPADGDFGSLQMNYGQTLRVWICAEDSNGPGHRAFSEITRSATLNEIMQMASGLEDGDLLPVDMTSLELLSTEGVTDPDELALIEEFNADVPEIRAAAAAYNEALDGLKARVETLFEGLGDCTLDVSDESFSFTSDLLTFSYSSAAVRLLSGSYEVVSSVPAGSGAIQLEIVSGGATHYLLAGETGLSLSGESFIPRGRNRGTDDYEGWQIRQDNIIEHVQLLGDVFDWMSLAGEAARILVDKVLTWDGRGFADFTRFLDLEWMDRFWNGVGAVTGILDAQTDILRLQQLAMQQSEINSIRQHGHPTEMEENDPVMALRVNMLESLVASATGMNVADTIATGVDAVAAVIPVLGKAKKALGITKKLEAAWEYSGVTGAAVDVVKNLVSNKLHDEYMDQYRELRETDNMLHYDFSGIVWDQKNRPLAGVTVTCGYNSVLTDSRGHYDMESPEAAARPTFTLKKYETENKKVVRMKPHQRETLSVILRSNRGHLAGTVYNEETGEPLEGAVVAYDEESFVTGADGKYSLSPLLGLVDASLTVSMTGYAPFSLPVTLWSTEEEQTEDAPLRPLGSYVTLSGRVTDRDTGAPLSGIRVKGTIVPVSGRSDILLAYSDYSWAGPAAGNYSTNIPSNITNYAFTDENGCYELKVPYAVETTVLFYTMSGMASVPEEGPYCPESETFVLLEDREGYDVSLMLNYLTVCGTVTYGNQGVPNVRVAVVSLVPWPAGDVMPYENQVRAQNGYYMYEPVTNASGYYSIVIPRGPAEIYYYVPSYNQYSNASTGTTHDCSWVNSYTVQCDFGSNYPAGEYTSGNP